jgi:hypothetical protein
MQKIQYKAKNGQMQWKPVFTKAVERAIQTEYMGFCLACGNTQDCCEPDARRYTCESCNAPKVYGLEQLLLMGLIQ